MKANSKREKTKNLWLFIHRESLDGYPLNVFHTNNSTKKEELWYKFVQKQTKMMGQTVFLNKAHNFASGITATIMMNFKN